MSRPPPQPGASQIHLVEDIGEEPSYSCLIQASFPLTVGADMGALETALVSKDPNAAKNQISRGGTVSLGAFGRMLDDVLPLGLADKGTGGVANRIVGTDFALATGPERSVTFETRVFLKAGVNGPAVFTLLSDAVAQQNLDQVVLVLSTFGEVTEAKTLRALVAAALNKPFP